MTFRSTLSFNPPCFHSGIAYKYSVFSHLRYNHGWGIVRNLSDLED